MGSFPNRYVSYIRTICWLKKQKEELCELWYIRIKEGDFRTIGWYRWAPGVLITFKI